MLPLELLPASARARCCLGGYMRITTAFCFGGRCFLGDALLREGTFPAYTTHCARDRADRRQSPRGGEILGVINKEEDQALPQIWPPPPPFFIAEFVKIGECFWPISSARYPYRR